jgi:hypothetical protein
VIERSIARKLGLTAVAVSTLSGVHGNMAAHELAPIRVDLAGHRSSVTPVSTDLSQFSRSVRRRIDAVIGLDYLRGTTLSIDYRGKQLLLASQSTTPRDAQSVSLVPINDALCLPVDVASFGTKMLRLDTGFTGGLQLPRVAARKVSGKNSFALNASTKRGLTQLTIGSGSPVNSPLEIVNRRSFPGEDGLVGNAVLSQFVVTIDFARHAMFLIPHRS